MDTNDKLIDDVKVALREAGYGNIVVRPSEPGTILSAEKGAAGAVFYLTPQIAAKTTLSRVATGGRAADADKVEATVVPSVAGVEELMTKDPDTAAGLLGIPTDRVRAVLRQTAL